MALLEELLLPHNGGADLVGSEIGIEDAHGSGSQRRAGTSLFNGDGQGDLRVLIGGEADEYTVVGGAAAQLGSAGLGAGSDHTVFEVGIDRYSPACPF